MKNKDAVWQEMLSILEEEVRYLGFEIWIRPLQPIKIEDGILVLCSPTPASKSEVISRFMPVFKGALRKIDDGPAEIVVVSKDELDSNDALSDVSGADDAPEAIVRTEPNPLNPKYIFENFVVGDCNSYAYKAACAVAEAPGEVYNPLFIYGGVGLGKTHIMQAIGNEVRMTMPNLKVLYVPAETFLNEFVESIGRRSNQSFRDKYRGADILMIDDIQFIGNKGRMQEEIFNTFEALKSMGKQMVFASDRLPQDIPDLDSRVRSRFASSLVVDMAPPDLVTRIAILKRKAQDAKVNIPLEMLEFIAQNVSSNIREMEGVLTKVIFLSRLRERKVDIDICREALNDYRVQTCDEVSADEIIDCTCRYFNLDKEDIVGKKKNKEIVVPRQIAIYLINDMLNIPLASIGNLFGGREHTTVMHARDKISAQYNSDAEIRRAVNDIRAMALRK